MKARGYKMRQVKITINTENDAFGDVYDELARILKELSEKFENCNEPEVISDYNGNKVGRVEYL